MTATFSKGERVILRGLLSDRFLNPAEVVEEIASASLDDGVRVRLLHSSSSSSVLVVRRRNLLRASVQSDRRLACQLHAIATHPGLRVTSPRLAERLGKDLVLATTTY